MDYFSEDSAHVTNAFWLNEPAASAHEDRITRKRWAKAVLAFYAFLFLAGGIAIGVHQSMTTSGGIEQQATLRTDNRFAH
jgi:phage terminase small subunit